MTNESNETTESNKPTTGYIPTLAQVDELHRKIAQSQAAHDLIHGHCVVVADIARRMAILMTARMDPELMTCRDVVSTGRYPYTGHLGVLRPEDKAIVEQSLRETDALDFADRPFQSISDGQRQRVLLARALCQQPELIVLDEPTSFLDIRYKLELLTILKRMVREEHLAVLMSLHELDLAARVSDTVVCVAGDRIDRVGPPSEIFTPDYIAALYRMEPGKYDPCFDSLEFVPGGAR